MYVPTEFGGIIRPLESNYCFEPTAMQNTTEVQRRIQDGQRCLQKYQLISSALTIAMRAADVFGSDETRVMIGVFVDKCRSSVTTCRTRRSIR